MTFQTSTPCSIVIAGFFAAVLCYYLAATYKCVMSGSMVYSPELPIIQPDNSPARILK